MGYAETIGGTRYVFPDVRTLLAKASPRRSGDLLAGVAAADATERVAAQLALADLPLRELVENPVVPYEAAQKDYRLLYAAGADVRMVPYPTTHKLHPNMLRDVNRWIMGNVNAATDALVGIEP